MLQTLVRRFTDRWTEDDEHRLQELQRYEQWLVYDLPWRIVSARARLEVFKRKPFTDSKEGRRARAYRLAVLESDLRKAQITRFEGNCAGDLGYVRSRIKRLSARKARANAK